MTTILPTTLVGSYPQPDWLIDRAKLAGRFPPRVRAKELWRVAPEWLEQAQDDATLLAIRDQERAGLDIITDGEVRRESYSNRFATALDGIDIDKTLCCLRVRTTELHASPLGERLGVGGGVRIQMKFYSGASRSKVRRSDCASAALSKICGATPRFSSASPSFMRRKPLVV